MDDYRNVNRENKFREFGESLLDSAGEGIRKGINNHKEEAYSQGIEVGIGKTIAALYEARVEDNEIIELMNKHWGMNMEETADRLIFEKRQAVTRELKLFLKLQGYSESTVRSFMIENRVLMQIKENPELQKLRGNPKKLKDILTKDEGKSKK